MLVSTGKVSFKNVKGKTRSYRNGTENKHYKKIALLKEIPATNIKIDNNMTSITTVMYDNEVLVLKENGDRRKLEAHK